MRSYAGKVSYVAGLGPTLRPFLGSIWRALADAADGGAGPARRRPLPEHLVHIRRVAHALRWLRAFFERQRGTLVRSHYTVEPFCTRLTVAVDASPWGIGGVLLQGAFPISYFADGLHMCDLDRFRATLGDSAHTTTWEALAILVALRLWRTQLHVRAALALRSDSLGALSATLRAGSRSESLGTILRELALEEAELGSAFTALEHIPGITNVWPDALSRLSAPAPKRIPEALRTVQRAWPAARTADFWLTARPPGRRKGES